MLQRRHGPLSKNAAKVAGHISWNCPQAVDPDFDDEDAAIAHYREAVTQHGCLPADFAAITDLFELPR